MQNFKKIDRKKTKLFSIENLIHCFCARLYVRTPATARNISSSYSFYEACFNDVYLVVMQLHSCACIQTGNPENIMPAFKWAKNSQHLFFMLPLCTLGIFEQVLDPQKTNMRRLWVHVISKNQNRSLYLQVLPVLLHNPWTWRCPVQSSVLVSRD